MSGTDRRGGRGQAPDEVRALWQACCGAVVAKMLTAVTRGGRIS